MSVRRYDSAKLGKVETTSHGFIRVPANVTRVGVLEYRDAAGKVTRELRHPDHVFAPESLATLEGVPVTDLHPPTFVNPTNVGELAVGFVSSPARQDGDFVTTKLTIQRSDAIDSVVVKRDRTEISMGYTCVPLDEPGVWRGQTYDVIQTQIKYDHAAILPTGGGRAGSEVCMRLDASVCVTESMVDSEKETMEVTELQTRLDAAEAKVKSLETDLGKSQAAVAANASALASYQAAERKDARDALESRARGVLGADVKFDGQTDRQIREAAILKVQPETKLDGLSDDFVSGAFEYLAGVQPAGRNDALGALRVAVEAPRTDGTPQTPKQVREAAIAARNNRWLKDTK